jgi:lipopolysaccharide export system protein LptA
MLLRILKFLIFSILAICSTNSYCASIAVDDIVIQSDDLVIDKITGTARFVGEVIVWFDDAVLKTTEIVVVVKEENKKRVLNKIMMPAKLTAMKQSYDEIIIADGGEYIAGKKLLRFKGNIYMQRDKRLIKCDELEYFTEIKGISSDKN